MTVPPIGSDQHGPSHRPVRSRRGGASSSASTGQPQPLGNPVPANQRSRRPNTLCEGCSRFHDPRTVCVDDDKVSGNNGPRDGHPDQGEPVHERYGDESQRGGDNDGGDGWNIHEAVNGNEEGLVQQVPSEDGGSHGFASIEQNWSNWGPDSAPPRPPVLLGVPCDVQIAPQRDIHEMLNELFVIDGEHLTHAGGPGSAGLQVPGADIYGDDEWPSPAPGYPYPAVVGYSGEPSISVAQDASLEGIDNEDLVSTGTWVPLDEARRSSSRYDC